MKWIKIKDVCRIINASRNTVYAITKRPFVPAAIKFGDKKQARVFYRESEIKDWVSNFKPFKFTNGERKMNSQITFSNPIAVNIDPITGHKTEFYTLNAFVEACIDRNSFKIKPETYIHPEYMDYDCDGCSVIPYVNPKDLSEVVGYTISGTKKFDTDKNPHELLDSKK